MNKLLSICIPTYNRAEFLSECLDHIIPQALEYHIPIYICDNASNDNTQTIISNQQSLYPYIFYKKQDSNVGIDHNMLDVVFMSTSKYCWWLGDDDIILDNSISKILKVLQLYNPDFLLLNTLFISEDLKTKYEKPFILLKKDMIYSDNILFFRDNASNMPFGNLVVDRDQLCAIDYNRFIGTSHAYSGVLLDYLESKKNSGHDLCIFINAEPLVYLRQCVKTWSKYSFNVYYQHIPNWYLLLLPAYQIESELLLKDFCKQMSALRVIIPFKLSGVINTQNTALISSQFTCFQKIKIKVIMLIPKLIINILINKYRQLKNIFL